jgi:hypothetical protein
MWFKKKDDDIDNKKMRGWLITEVNSAFMEIDKLKSKITSLEIDMRFLQDKMKNKIFKKPTEEETNETNKKPSVFLNPYGNPI